MPAVERFCLTPEYTISRVIKGGWQLAGGHGVTEREQALSDMLLYAEQGITTFDCADIYTGVEGLIGEFLRRYRGAIRSGALPGIQVHTKYVPDLGALPTLTRRDVQPLSIDPSTGWASSVWTWCNSTGGTMMSQATWRRPCIWTRCERRARSNRSA